MGKSLLTFKEYCIKHNMTDGAVRKKEKSGKIKTVSLDNLKYIVIEEENNSYELKKELEKKKTTISSMKREMKLLKDKIKILEENNLAEEKYKEKIESTNDKLIQVLEKNISNLENVIVHQERLLKADNLLDI